MNDKELFKAIAGAARVDFLQTRGDAETADRINNNGLPSLLPTYDEVTPSELAKIKSEIEAEKELAKLINTIGPSETTGKVTLKEAELLVEDRKLASSTTGWDFPKGEPIPFFDISCSYELTGYRPINETDGLDFKIEPFIEVRRRFEQTGRYAPAPSGTADYDNFWFREYTRFKEGCKIGKYTITGDLYYFINYYQLPKAATSTYAGSGKLEGTADFYVALYEYFHYVELCKRLRKDAIALKGRGLGWSEIAGNIVTTNFIGRKKSRSVVAAYSDLYLDKTLNKVFNLINHANENSDGGLFKPLGVDQPRRKITFIEELKTKVRKGWLSDIEGIVADNPRKIRGDRPDILFMEEFGCFQSGTLVLMYDGSIREIETIKEGEFVMGDDGTPREVLQLHHGVDLMFKLEIPHSSDQIVNSGHIVYGVTSRSGKRKFKMTALELYDLLENSPRYVILKSEDFLSEKYLHFRMEAAGVGEYYGFTISGNHLFCLADRTVVHNSWPQSLDAYITADALVLLNGIKTGIRIAFGCVMPGTKVYNHTRGLVNAESIKTGDKIYTLRKNSNNTKLCKVLFEKPKMYKDCVRVETDRGWIECSKDHPLLCKIGNTRKDTLRLYEAPKGLLGYLFLRVLDLIDNPDLNTQVVVANSPIFNIKNGVEDVYAYANGYNYLNLNKEVRYRLPKYLHNYNRECIYNWISGFMERHLIIRDYYNNDVRYAYMELHNEDFTREFAYLLNRCGVFPMWNYQGTVLTFDVNSNLQKLRKKLPTIGPVLDTALKEAEKTHSTKVFSRGNYVQSPKYKDLGVYYQGTHFDGHGLATITSIIDLGKQEVINFGVEEAHSYISNSFVSHNTGGDSGPALAGLKKIFYNPEEYGVLPMRHNYTSNGEYIITGFFIPSYRIVTHTLDEFGNLVKIMDDRGYTRKEDGMKHYDKKRAVGSDPQAAARNRAEYCYTPDEAFALEGENMFNKHLITELLVKIRELRQGLEIHNGFLEYLFAGNKLEEENIRGVKFLANKNGKVLLIEHPQKDDSGADFKNLYVAGIDAIDLGMAETSTETRDPSKFCIVIMKRAYGIDPPRIVAIYRDRPNDIREAYRTALKLLQYYNCKAVLEFSKIGFKHFLESKNLTTKHLMRRTRATMSDNRNSRQFGVPATKEIIEHQLLLIANFVEDYSLEIWFPEILEELLSYTYSKKTRFDIVAALGMCLLGAEELSAFLPVSQSNKKLKWGGIGFFTDEFGRKRFGALENHKQPESKIFASLSPREGYIAVE